MIRSKLTKVFGEMWIIKAKLSLSAFFSSELFHWSLQSELLNSSFWHLLNKSGYFDIKKKLVIFYSLSGKRALNVSQEE